MTKLKSYKHSDFMKACRMYAEHLLTLVEQYDNDYNTLIEKRIFSEKDMIGKVCSLFDDKDKALKAFITPEYPGSPIEYEIVYQYITFILRNKKNIH